MIRTLKGRLHLYVGDGGGHREYLGASRQVPGSALGAVDPRTPFAKVATLESVKIEFSEFSKVPEPLKNKNKTPNLSLRPIRGLEMIF